MAERTMDQPQLDYQPRPHSQRQMSLQRTTDQTTLVFPTEPEWVHWFTVAGAFLNMGLAMAALLLLSPFRTWRGSLLSPGGIELLIVCGTLGLEAAVLGLIGAFELINARICGQIPRQIAFDGAELVSVHFGWSGMVQKRWSLRDVRWIRTSTRRSLVPQHGAIHIIIGLAGHWFALRACAYGKDRQVAGDFARLLEEALRDYQGDGRESRVA
jgi:hypothetical protein